MDGQVTFVDLTPQLGEFSPCILIYFPQLLELDITGCRGIDSELLNDCIGACSNLQRLEMRGCKQCSQHIIVQIVRKLPNLVYFDASNAGHINYVNAYNILCHLPKLNMANFTPQEIFEQLDDWTNLYRTFRDVHFGVNIMMYLPNYGRNLRLDLLPED